MDAMRFVQDLPFSTWIRESNWALFAFLIIHVYGMGFLAGAGALICARAMGLAKSIEPRKFGLFVPVMWGGFIFSLVSGLLLLMAYPAKALTNPIYYLKFVFLIGAVLLTRQLLVRFKHVPEGETVLPPWTKVHAVAILVMWVGVITCGKLIEYTHTHLLLY